MKIIVASKNPVKIRAAILGCECYFNEVEAEGVSVESGVSDQPMSDEETYTGAHKRVKNSKQLCAKADLWVGIEGGIEKRGNGFSAFAWVLVYDGKKWGKARTTSFMLPPRVADLIEEGYELGTANDILFKHENSKQKSGAVGILTQNVVSRTKLYTQAVQLALIPFVNPEFY